MLDYLLKPKRSDFSGVRAFTIDANYNKQLDILFNVEPNQLKPAANAYLNRLVNTQTIRDMKKVLYPSAKAMLEAFGIERPHAPLSPSEEKYLDYMRLRSQEARKREYTRRLHAEFREAERNNWYVLFDTLTYDNNWLAKSQREGNSHIGHYTRHIGELCTRAVHGSIRYKTEPDPITRKSTWKRHSVSDNYRYFAVPEYGSDNGRIHFHIIHFCRDLPTPYKTDPMRHATDKRRELMAFKGLWPFGFSATIPARTCPTDRWGKDGFYWPRDKKSGGPLKSVGIGPMANYLTKYISKSIAEKAKGDFPWRISMTRNLGNQILEQLIPDLDQAIQVLDCQKTWLLRQLKQPHHLLPSKSLLRRYAMKKLSVMYADSQIQQIQRTLHGQTNILRALRNKSLVAKILSNRCRTTSGTLDALLERVSKHPGYTGKKRFTILQVRQEQKIICEMYPDLIELLDYYAIKPDKQIQSGGTYGRHVQRINNSSIESPVRLLL